MVERGVNKKHVVITRIGRPKKRHKKNKNRKITPKEVDSAEPKDALRRKKKMTTNKNAKKIDQIAKWAGIVSRANKAQLVFLEQIEEHLAFLEQSPIKEQEPTPHQGTGTNSSRHEIIEEAPCLERSNCLTGVKYNRTECVTKVQIRRTERVSDYANV